MTKNRVCATDTALPAHLSREDMHSEALAIEELLSAALAIHNTATPGDAIDLIQMAQDRASALCNTLDSANAPEGLTNV